MILQINTVFNIELQFQTAPFHIRFVAWLLDSIIIYAYYLIMTAALGLSFDLDELSQFGLLHLLVIIPFILYHVINEFVFKGQSLGKMMMGIRIVSTDGQKPSVSQILLRWMLRPIDFGFTSGIGFLFNGDTFIGSLFILASIVSIFVYSTSKYNQRIGDVVAGTAVVSKKLPYQLSDTIFQELDMPGYTVTFPQVMRLTDKDINLLDNLVKHHQRSSMDLYVVNVASKLKKVLHIETDMPDDFFLETMLRDYNYLSRMT